MDAYDEGSNARHGPDEPSGSDPRPAPPSSAESSGPDPHRVLPASAESSGPEPGRALPTSVEPGEADSGRAQPAPADRSEADSGRTQPAPADPSRPDPGQPDTSPTPPASAPAPDADPPAPTGPPPAPATPADSLAPAAPRVDPPAPAAPPAPLAPSASTEPPPSSAPPPEPLSPAAPAGSPTPDPISLAGSSVPSGVAALSLRHQIVAAVALAVVAAVVCTHLGMAFLHVAPLNTVSKEHGETVEDWIYPEFEQNWKLFAPNPLQQNVAVQVRAEVREADGGLRTTRWYDLSAEDGRAIDGNPVPSHTRQNELRRAWDFFVATHDDDNRPVGLRGALSETYLRRITVLRLDRADAAGAGGVVLQVQIRSRTTNVPPPEWSDEKISTSPVYRTLPWWPVPEDEARGGVG